MYHSTPTWPCSTPSGGVASLLEETERVPKRRSSVLFGVGEDAAIVARSIATHRPPQRTAPPSA